MEIKTIVITGSTRGIGHGLAMEFLKRGHQVILNGRDEALVRQTVEELKTHGTGVIGVAGDVTDEGTFQKLIDQSQSLFGKIDIWINNAGVPQTQNFFHLLESSEIERLVSVNITSLMVGTRIAIGFFMHQGYGKVFNMEGFGSDGRMMDKLSLYGTSKRAVNYFTKSVSKEIKDEKIQVGILSPGMVRTDFLTGAMATGSDAEQERNKKVFDILAENVDVVTEFLTSKMLISEKKYDRIEFLTKRRLIPKLFKLMFLKH
jgi:short-subunit dehydrogenase